VSERGQALIEFSLTVGLLMLLVVVTAQVAIFLNYRSSLDLATREGAYQASLVGHQPRDGQLETQSLWAKLEPGAQPADVTVSREGNLVVVTASAYAPAILPIPFPPFTRLPVQARSVHTIEQFEPGSS
jgi:Flp pilus assembly protein TadG